MHLQSTKPQTIGYALTDSPIGLAAYIIEKYRSWSDCDGDIESRFTKDELLTNIMIYWVTKSITSSMRLYKSSFNMFLKKLPYLEKPTACAAFPGEIVIPPRSQVEQNYNVVSYSIMPKGGHFAGTYLLLDKKFTYLAFEEPELFTKDLRTFANLLIQKQVIKKDEL